MKKVFFAAAILSVLVGCQTTKSTNLTPTDIYGNFQLVQFDTENIQSIERPMNIGFEQGLEGNLKVHGVLCNTFMGQAQLANGKLTSEEGLTSTRMACFREKEAAMETALGEMFRNGATVKLKGTTLTLEGTGHKFTYEKK